MSHATPLARPRRTTPRTATAGKRSGVTIFDGSASLHVPAWVADLDTFRQWTDADDYPENLPVWWLCGEVWADMTKEQLFSHVALKTEITAVLHTLAKSGKLGRVFADGTLLTNVEADISGNPDLTFVSEESFETGRVQVIEGKNGGHTELQGTPDMVLEVVSRSSVQKDTDVLRKAYWKAGIHEYWLVDARQDLSFEMLKHTAKGYVATRGKGGWLRSLVFGAAFRLTQTADRRGHPEYTLDVR